MATITGEASVTYRKGDGNFPSFLRTEHLVIGHVIAEYFELTEKDEVTITAQSTLPGDENSLLLSLHVQGLKQVFTDTVGQGVIALLRERLTILASPLPINLMVEDDLGRTAITDSGEEPREEFSLY